MAQSDDRHDIRDLCARYALMLDARDWTGLRAVFTSDATMTFAHLGDVYGASAISETCQAALETLDTSQHLVGTILPVIDGDTARCSSYFQAQHVSAGTKGGDTLIVAGRYDDELVRWPEGWRIAWRIQSVTWTSGNEYVVS